MIIKEQFEKKRRAAFIELLKFVTDSRWQYCVRPLNDGWEISYRTEEVK